MDERDWLAQQFGEHRTRTGVVAYRMIGSLSEADDAVEDAWLRLSRNASDEIESLGGWVTFGLHDIFAVPLQIAPIVDRSREAEKVVPDADLETPRRGRRRVSRADDPRA